MAGDNSTQTTALRTRVREATSRVLGLVRAAPPARPPLEADPARQASYTAERPRRFPLTLPLQNLANGQVTPQAGGGRPVIPAYLAVAPIQSITPMPDGRAIARPLPNAAGDQRQVIT